MLRRNAATTHTKAQIHMLTQCAHNVHTMCTQCAHNVHTMCTQCAHNVHTMCTHVVFVHTCRDVVVFVFFRGFFTFSRGKKRRGNYPPLGPNVTVRRFATMPMATAGKLWPAGGARLGIPARFKKNPWDRLGYPWIAYFLIFFGEIC